MKVPKGYHVVIDEHCDSLQVNKPWYKTISAIDKDVEISDLKSIGFPHNAMSSMLV